MLEKEKQFFAGNVFLQTLMSLAAVQDIKRSAGRLK